MSLLQYFKLRDGLPDPKSPLCNSVASNSAVTLANMEGDRQEEEMWPVYKHFSNSCVPYDFIHIVASNTANSGYLLHVHYVNA